MLDISLVSVPAPCRVAIVTDKVESGNRCAMAAAHEAFHSPRKPHPLGFSGQGSQG